MWAEEPINKALICFAGSEIKDSATLVGSVLCKKLIINENKDARTFNRRRVAKAVG